METKKIIGVPIGIVMIIASYFILHLSNLFYFISVIAIITATFPFILAIMSERKKQKELDDKFLEFTRDLVENVKSGTPISKGIINLKSRNYGALSNYVDKLANQISLGIPLTTALVTFARDTKSPVIARAVNLISEAERSGGQISSILESVSESVNQTEQLKKERRSAIYSLVVQGYIIFLVFILIMLILQFKIIPMIPSSGDLTGLDVKIQAVNPAQFSLPLLIMLLVQATFCGLVIGKISEGSIKDGIKHSFILLALTLIIKTGANVLFGS
jgi:archaeal flagellar protein FlaJ